MSGGTSEPDTKALQPGDRVRRRLLVSAGVLLYAGAFLALAVTSIAQSIHPGYDTAVNTLSDLGTGPTAVMWNLSLFAWGGLVLLAVLLCLASRSRYAGPAFVVTLAVFGGAQIGVSLVPAHTGELLGHDVLAGVYYAAGGILGIVGLLVTRGPFRAFSVVLGVFTLAAALLYGLGIHFGLGQGGMERLVAYPIVAWQLGFGGFLLAFARGNP